MQNGQALRSMLLVVPLWAAACGNSAPHSSPVASIEPLQPVVVAGQQIELTGSAGGYVQEAGLIWGYWGVHSNWGSPVCPYAVPPSHCCSVSDADPAPDPASCPHGWLSGHSGSFQFPPYTATFHAPDSPQTVIVGFTSTNVLGETASATVAITIVAPP